MKFNISIINVTQQTKPTAKGSYTLLDVAYKNESSGKTEGKKVMSFAQKETFNVLSKATPGQSYIIESVKNESTGYWDWVNAELTTGESQPVAANKSTGNTTPKSTYETADERAARQVLIVRQSSLTAAINTLPEKVRDPETIKKVAQEYVDWVFQKDTPNPNFSDMEEDVPV